MDAEQYLFPFERVPKGSRIVIYGAGVKGQSYLRQMLMSGYCTVAAMADKNHAGYQNCVVPVCAPEQIHAFAFDYVVIALRYPYYLDLFREILHTQGVSDERIVYEPDREALPIFEEKNDESRSRNEDAVAIYLQGGIGDYIIQKKVMETLIELAPGIQMDLYSTQAKSFLTYLYQETPQIRSIEWNLGTRFQEVQDTYAAALHFGMTRWIDVPVLREERLPKRLADVLHRLQEHSSRDTEQHAVDMPVALIYYRCRFKKESCYQHLTFGGIIPYEGYHVRMPSSETGRRAFRALGLGTYVTVNFGNGESRDIQAIAKAWPQERFEQVIAGIHDSRPDLQVVQLGTAGAAQLSGADAYVLGGSFDLVSEVLRHSLLHIDIEGGLVHFATQLGTKCLVLYGPTPAWFYGYPENIHLQAGDCHGCCGLYPDWNCCARDMKDPECMYGITAEMVLEKALAYLD